MTRLEGSIYFRKFREDKQTFNFSKGINIIYGESGVGKTNFLEETQGAKEQSKNNFVLTYLSNELKYYRIYQNPDHQIIASTVSKELTFSGECKLLNPDELEKVFKWGMSCLPASIRSSANPGYLSGGEKELLNLVTSIDFDPDVLLIDDGFSFLSEKNKAYCVKMLQDWADNSDGIIIWVTSLKEDLQYSEQSWILALDSFKPYKQDEKNKYSSINIPGGDLSLEIDKLNFHYENSSNIYSDLSFYEENIRSLGIFGDNGTGKTTFAGLCFGDLKPVSGNVDLCIDGRSDLKIGYLDQFPEHLILMKKVSEFFSELKEKEIFDIAFEQTFKNRLTRFGVQWEQIQNKGADDIPWAVLRIFLVVLLCHCRFDILILDEPTFGLGWEQKVKLRSFLRKCMSHMHFMIVSHDRKFVRSICDKIVDLDLLTLENKIIEINEKTKSQRSHN